MSTVNIVNYENGAFHISGTLNEEQHKSLSARVSAIDPKAGISVAPHRTTVRTRLKDEVRVVVNDIVFTESPNKLSDMFSFDIP